MAKKKTTWKQTQTDLCRGCSALCCQYFALPIETPEDWDDYDDIRWYLCHEGITVFIEDGDWYLNVENKCRHLNEDHRCGYYTLRPGICRKYKTNDCDRTGQDYGYELYFQDDKQMEEYMRIKFGPRVFEKLGKKPQPQKKKKKQ